MLALRLVNPTTPAMSSVEALFKSSTLWNPASYKFSAFTAPNPLKMNKVGGENIALEINKGVGTAWVPANNKRQAQDKLTNMIEVTEFTN